MYMFTFVFLLIVIIGIFSQVFTLQVARFDQQQTVAGQQILLWHELAVRYARQQQTAPAPNTLNFPATGEACRISLGTTNIYAPEQPDTPNCNRRMTNANLPSGSPPFIAINYRFESVIFQPLGTSQRFVMTYVPAHPTDVDAPRLPMNLPLREVITQLRRALPENAPNVGMVEQTAAGPPPTCVMRKTVGTADPLLPLINISYPVANVTVAGVLSCVAPTGSVAVFTIL